MVTYSFKIVICIYGASVISINVYLIKFEPINCLSKMPLRKLILQMIYDCMSVFLYQTCENICTRHNIMSGYVKWKLYTGNKKNPHILVLPEVSGYI